MRINPLAITTSAIIAAGLISLGLYNRRLESMQDEQREPVPVERVEPVSVEQVKRYSDGNVLSLNRLVVDWRTNEKCRYLEKYGNTTGYVLFDNVTSVLERYPKDGVFQHGFELEGRPGDVSLFREYPWGYWESGLLYVRESTETPQMLVALGREILDNACNDPEQKAK